MQINGATQVYGIIGNPVSHSFSPSMHNAAFEAAGINAVYVPFHVKNLLQLKHSLRQLNIRGLSVTIPHKIHIRRMLDGIDPLALQIGSVNTVLFTKQGLLQGYNTDGPGAIRAIIESGFNLKGSNILVIGSGGSARAILYSLIREKPAAIGILSRNVNASLQLARNIRLVKKPPVTELIYFEGILKKKSWRIPQKFAPVELISPGQIENYDLIIQTTPMGMRGHDEKSSPLPPGYIHKGQTVFDIVYTPKKTALLNHAAAVKAATIEGYKMLLYQGILQFELFTGTEAPVEVMQKALKKELKGVE